MSSVPVKVRIAPSPTGYLHVGTARTALFNYLYARHTGGRFVVRIEDTDVARSQPELIDPIIDALHWLGIESDEPIVFQSQRGEIYTRYLQQFLATGHAYYCFSTPEEVETERALAREEKRQPKFKDRDTRLTPAELQKRLDAGERPVIRVRIPDGETTYDDIVSGTLTRQNSDIEDLIIARSDGTVTYNFAVVVDDHDMGITHVIRGNDHITNTFKQVIMYDAFGFVRPRFGHVPLILRPDKKKVSKRLGDKDVGQYRNDGIIPEAMINYLALLGWSPKNDREIYKRDELIDAFSLENLTKANAVFDEEKLEAFNREHIQFKSDHELAVLVAPMLVDAGLSTKYWLETRWEYLRTVVEVLKDRVRRIGDFVKLGGYFFSFDYKYDEAAAAKHFTPEAADLLAELSARFEALAAFTKENAEAALKSLAEDKGVKPANLIHPTRLAVSGMSIGPGLYDLLVTLGQTVVVERLKKAVEFIHKSR